MRVLTEPTERYLQSVFELAEEGRIATRTAIGRKLHRHSATMSQATTQLVRSGLIHTRSSRKIHVTTRGGAAAVAIVRKHRILECFLHEIVGLELGLVHDEAARWQHVVTDGVEARIARLLGAPRESPFGCAIPGVDDLLDGRPSSETVRAWVGEEEPGSGSVSLVDLVPHVARPDLRPLSDLAGPTAPAVVTVRRLTETLQSDAATLRQLAGAAVLPGSTVSVVAERDQLLLTNGPHHCRVGRAAAAEILGDPL